MNGHPLPPEALDYYEAQHYDRTESTRAECCMEAGWTIFCALVLALAFLSARVADGQPAQTPHSLNQGTEP